MPDEVWLCIGHDATDPSLIAMGHKPRYRVPLLGRKSMARPYACCDRVAVPAMERLTQVPSLISTGPNSASIWANSRLPLSCIQVPQRVRFLLTFGIGDGDQRLLNQQGLFLLVAEAARQRRRRKSDPLMCIKRMRPAFLNSIREGFSGRAVRQSGGDDVNNSRASGASFSLLVESPTMTCSTFVERVTKEGAASFVPTG